MVLTHEASVSRPTSLASLHLEIATLVNPSSCMVSEKDDNAQKKSTLGSKAPLDCRSKVVLPNDPGSHRKSPRLRRRYQRY